MDSIQRTSFIQPKVNEHTTVHLTMFFQPVQVKDQKFDETQICFCFLNQVYAMLDDSFGEITLKMAHNHTALP